jgi:hypothetical protein
MSIVSDIFGAPVVAPLKPANTSTATLYTAPAGGILVKFAGLNIACEANAAASVWISIGGTDYLLISAKAMTAGQSDLWTFGYPVLRAGQSIKVKSSVADALTFVGTFEQSVSRGGT